MDRVIKFRGKYVKDQQWIYGGYCNSTYGNVYITCRRHFFNVDPDTVGQFTGFKDVDGKDIFEGDIIQNNASYDEEMYSISMISGCWWGLVPGGSMENYEDFNSLSWLLDNGEFKVIGNIHDNPELLEGDKING